MIWVLEEEERRSINWDELEAVDAASGIPSPNKDPSNSKNQATEPGATAYVSVTTNEGMSKEKGDVIIGQLKPCAPEEEMRNLEQKSAATDLGKCHQH